MHVWVSTLVVPRTDLVTLLGNLANRTLTTDDLPKFHMPDDVFIGEYPWHLGVPKDFEWFRPEDVDRIQVAVLPTVGTYTASTGGHDHAIDDTVSVHVPAPWLLKMLEARLQDGQALRYVDPENRTVFFDPATELPGPHAALVYRDLFLKRLAERDLTPVWVVHSRKSAHGRDDARQGFGGEVSVTRIYTIRNGRFEVQEYIGKHKPSVTQLRAFLGEPQPTIKLTSSTKRSTTRKGAKRGVQKKAAKSTASSRKRSRPHRASRRR